MTVEGTITQEDQTRPKLRLLDPQPVDHQGQRYLALRDPLGLTDKTVMVPQALAPLLPLCDGSRTPGELRVGFMLRTGVELSGTQVDEFLASLDGALLLENGAFQEASQHALSAYREASSRKPSRASLGYPADPRGLADAIAEYEAQAPVDEEPLSPTARLTGVVCPHIDYDRGGVTYAQLWRRCAPALDDIELAIVFGTDHSGGPGTLTPTAQSYATPLGVLPTESRLVDGLAEVLGPDRAFAEELHHVNEHSIELALVWFHHYIGGRACPVVPVLCGSFQQFVDGEEELSENEPIEAALSYLRDATSGRRTLVIAAADLAHVGPAFGDLAPIDPVQRATVAAKDARSIEAICDGDASAFFALSREEGDSRRVCGLPPIYIALSLLDGARGESLGYAQCPADVAGGSLVSIAGALLFDDA